VSLTEEEAKKIAHAIAFGHAYAKHAADQAEVSELLTQSSFESLVLETLLNPDLSRSLRNDRLAFWNHEEGFLVLYNPNDPDQGTTYWPHNGIDGYKSRR
jgi:hypothetical protein